MSFTTEGGIRPNSRKKLQWGLIDTHLKPPEENWRLLSYNHPKKWFYKHPKASSYNHPPCSLTKNKLNKTIFTNTFKNQQKLLKIRHPNLHHFARRQGANPTRVKPVSRRSLYAIVSLTIFTKTVIWTLELILSVLTLINKYR